MSKSIKKIFSIILSLLMIVTVYTPALADGIAATGVRLSESNITLYLGSTSNQAKTLTAIITPSDYNGTVTWSSSTDDIISLTSTGKTANITANAVGTTTVKVTVKDYQNKDISASCTVTVIQDAPSYIEITGDVNGETKTVSGTTNGVSVLRGDSLQLIATEYMKSGEIYSTDPRSLSWSSTDSSIVNTDSTGNITGSGLGNATITAKDETNNISASVKCYSYKIDKIEISGENTMIANGPEITLTAKVTTTPTIPEIYPNDRGWSNNALIQKVNTSGFTATYKGIASGTSNVTYTQGGVTSSEFSVTVTNYTASTPTITHPTTTDQTEFYIIKNQALLPTLSVSASSINTGGLETTLNYQWYKTSSPLTSGNDTIITGARSSTYTLTADEATTVGDEYYYCTVSETYDSKTSTAAYSSMFKVTTKEPYDIIISGDSDNTIVIGTPETLYANVYKNTTSSSFKLTQTSVSGTSVTWTSSNSVLSLTETGSSTTATGTAPIDLVTITATTTCDSVTYQAQKTTKVTYESQINPGAVVSTGSASYSFGGTNKDTSVSIVNQLKNSNADILYIKFTSFTNTYGTLSTNSKDTKYYISTPSSATTPYYLSDIKYSPGGKTGTDIYNYNAFDSNDSLIASGKISVEVKDDYTDTIDIAYSVTKDTSISLDEEDFIKWFLAENTQYASLTDVVFTSSPQYGGMYATTSSSANASVGSSEYYTSNGKPESSSSYRMLSGVHYKGTSVGTDKITFSAQGIKTNGSIATEEGTLYICVTNGNVANINYSLKYGSNATMSETDFSNVYKTALGVSVAPQFSIRILSIPDHVTLYRYGTENSSYQIYASQPTNLYVNNSDENSSYNVRNVICVPSSVWSGPEYSQYAVYDSSGVLKYVGKIAYSYDSAQQKFTCGAEGYTFKISDFVSADDTDPIISVSFTPLADTDAGRLYYNYKNGRGNLVNSTSKYTTTTGGSITSVTYIPKASSLISQTISYNAETRSGKQISGDITITYTKRYSPINFTDVSDSWAIPAVDYVSEWGISSGTGGSKFTPNGTMQRGMLVTMLYRIAGSPSVSGISNPFKDVSSSAYYYNAVLWAYSNNIVNGTSSKTFSPTAAISRQDIATMLYRFAGSPDVSSTSNVAYYRDSGYVSNYAMKSISWAISEGIMSGSNNRLTPTSSGTRAQVAAMLHRYLTN